MKKVMQYTFIISGVYTLLCIPLIYMFEYLHINETPLHSSQFFAVFICFVTSLIYRIMIRKDKFTPMKALSSIALTLSTLWIGFLIFVIFSFALSEID